MNGGNRIVGETNVNDAVFTPERDHHILQELCWSPYLSLEDAYKQDDVRDALRRGDLETVMTLARVFRMTPVFAPQGLEQKAAQPE